MSRTLKTTVQIAFASLLAHTLCVGGAQYRGIAVLHPGETLLEIAPAGLRKNVGQFLFRQCDGVTGTGNRPACFDVSPARTLGHPGDFLRLEGTDMAAWQSLEAMIQVLFRRYAGAWRFLSIAKSSHKKEAQDNPAPCPAAAGFTFNVPVNTEHDIF